MSVDGSMDGRMDGGDWGKRVSKRVSTGAQLDFVSLLCRCRGDLYV